MNVYLDSSAIVKRYIKEAGTEIMDLVFGYAEDGHIKLFFYLEYRGSFRHISRSCQKHGNKCV